MERNDKMLSKVRANEQTKAIENYYADAPIMQLYLKQLKQKYGDRFTGFASSSSDQWGFDVVGSFTATSPVSELLNSVGPGGYYYRTIISRPDSLIPPYTRKFKITTRPATANPYYSGITLVITGTPEVLVREPTIIVNDPVVRTLTINDPNLGQGQNSVFITLSDLGGSTARAFINGNGNPQGSYGGGSPNAVDLIYSPLFGTPVDTIIYISETETGVLSVGFNDPSLNQVNVITTLLPVAVGRLGSTSVSRTLSIWMNQNDTLQFTAMYD